jgi:ankyrin repeat protein
MINVIKALNKMRNFQTKQIQSVGDIDSVLNNTTSPKKIFNSKLPNIHIESLGPSIIEEKNCYDDNNMEEMRVFSEIRKIYRLFDYVASGDTNNIDYIVNCFKNDPENKKEKIDKSKLIVNKLDNNGKSLLYIASIYGNIKIVKILIDNGADIFYRCKVNIK